MGDTKKTPCKYGDKCYRKNPDHLKEFSHPKDDEASKPQQKKVFPLFEKKKQPDSSANSSNKPPKGNTGSDPASGKQEAEPAKTDDAVSSTERSKNGEPPEKRARTASPISAVKSSETTRKSMSDSEDGDANGTGASSNFKKKFDSDVLKIGKLENLKDQKNFIKDYFLVDMPEDFYAVWELAKTLDAANPKSAFKSAGIELCGAFHVLAGLFDNVQSLTPEDILVHDRYALDPPEFQTVAKSASLHIGYLRDDPKESSAVLCTNTNEKNGWTTLRIVGDNLFAALHHMVGLSIKDEASDSKKTLLSAIEKEAKAHNYSLEINSQKVRDRKKRVVAPTVHSAGIVVPMRDDVGYRELPETNGMLKKMISGIGQCKDANLKAAKMEKILEIITYVQFANDECDYGMGLGRKELLDEMKPKAKGSSLPSAGAGGRSKGKVSKKKSAGPPSAEAPSPAAGVPEFVDVAPFDHDRHCPRYCILVERDADSDPATSDELDPVQHELEQILLHNMKRQGDMTNELSALTDGEVPSTSEMQAESSRDRSTPTPLILRRIQSDLLITGGSTTAASRSATPTSNTPSPASKVKIRLPHPTAHRRPKGFVGDLGDSGGESSDFGKPIFAPIPLLDARGRRRMYFWPQNHMPDKFWQFVSEYCHNIDPEDVSGIRELLSDNSEDKNSKFFRCPGLGKHYSLRWNQEDAAAKKAAEGKGKIGGKKRKLNSPDPASGGESSDLDRKFSRIGSPERKAKKDGGKGLNGHAGTDHYSLGPLTERLVQALVEEGTLDQDHAPAWMDNFGEVKEMPDLNGVNSPNRTLIKSLNLGNMAALEKRIQKELEDQGLLDGEDDSDYEEPTSSAHKQEDEVTEELRKRQEELRSVSEGNRKRLSHVLGFMETSQSQQELESQLVRLDKEVLELYERFYSLVPKRKPSSKKERDQLWKALKERQKLVQKLDAF